ncbi:CLUMA_CG019083, isoform A [Clunio marinus]|uniref:CLUMA_CG019083, isoform A n=1 Tax=Clunio marinus TaxID=568069 RepID=A0A1J1J0N0_9DIPT|nr:CLUMA_CG019083, isoform A [Clunio marinus]
MKLNLLYIVLFFVNCLNCAIGENITDSLSKTSSRVEVRNVSPKPQITTSTTPPNFFISTLDNIRKFFFNPTADRRVEKPIAKAQIQILPRTAANRQNLLVDDVTKPENKSKIAVITKRMNVVEEDELLCPTEREAKFELFPVICNNNQDCVKVGKRFRCCKLFGGQRCHEGFEKPLEDVEHEPLFGIPRKCPKDQLAESFWDVKSCDIDKDCDFPRICCPNGRKRYCMNSYTEPEELPVGRQIAYPVESLSQYFQCTPPPPAAFDKHPKPCNSSLTCFPNVCCLEGGRKHCRPPKRNILAALTTFGQRFNVGWIKDFTDNLVIKRK